MSDRTKQAQAQILCNFEHGVQDAQAALQGARTKQATLGDVVRRLGVDVAETLSYLPSAAALRFPNKPAWMDDGLEAYKKLYDLPAPRSLPTKSYPVGPRGTQSALNFSHLDSIPQQRPIEESDWILEQLAKDYPRAPYEDLRNAAPEIVDEYATRFRQQRATPAQPAQESLGLPQQRPRTPGAVPQPSAPTQPLVDPTRAPAPRGSRLKQSAIRRSKNNEAPFYKRSAVRTPWGLGKDLWENSTHLRDAETAKDLAQKAPFAAGEVLTMFLSGGAHIPEFQTQLGKDVFHSGMVYGTGAAGATALGLDYMNKHSAADGNLYRNRVTLYIHNDKGQLLVSTAGDGYDYPAGGTENSKVDEAAQREALEEVGWEVGEVKNLDAGPVLFKWHASFAKKQKAKGRDHDGWRNYFRYARAKKRNKKHYDKEGDGKKALKFVDIDKLLTWHDRKKNQKSNPWKKMDAAHAKALRELNKKLEADTD